MYAYFCRLILTNIHHTLALLLLRSKFSSLGKNLLQKIENFTRFCKNPSLIYHRLQRVIVEYSKCFLKLAVVSSLEQNRPDLVYSVDCLRTLRKRVNLINSLNEHRLGLHGILFNLGLELDFVVI
jgi:hypothetical protein